MTFLFLKIILRLSCPALIVPCPYPFGLVAPSLVQKKPLLANLFLNKLALDIPNKIPRNLFYFYFIFNRATSFINKPESSET